VRMEARGNKWTIILDLRHNNFACASLHNQCTIAFAEIWSLGAATRVLEPQDHR
jgi:hypothetical protein